MNLTIVESKAKAKTIHKCLGQDWIDLATGGHVFPSEIPFWCLTDSLHPTTLPRPLDTSGTGPPIIPLHLVRDVVIPFEAPARPRGRGARCPSSSLRTRVDTPDTQSHATNIPP